MLVDFVMPMANKRSRTNNQAWQRCTFVGLRFQMRLLSIVRITYNDAQSGKSLSKSHFIAQDTMESERTQESKPVDTILLIPSQGSTQRERDGIWFQGLIAYKLCNKFSLALTRC